MITLKELLMNRITFEQLSAEQKANVLELLERINRIRQAYGKPMVVSSGYRSPEDNKKAGGAPNSNHCKAAAVDIADPRGELQAWCLAHIPELEKAQLWCEDFSATTKPNGKSWCHFQIFSPKSGKRFFKP